MKSRVYILANMKTPMMMMKATQVLLISSCFEMADEAILTSRDGLQSSGLDEEQWELWLMNSTVEIDKRNKAADSSLQAGGGVEAAYATIVLSRTKHQNLSAAPPRCSNG